MDEYECEEISRLANKIFALLQRNKADIPMLASALAVMLHAVVIRDYTDGDPVAAALYNAETFRPMAQNLARQQHN
jgi:hypothetical protein